MQILDKENIYYDYECTRPRNLVRSLVMTHHHHCNLASFILVLYRQFPS